HLATGGDDSVIRVWNTATGTLTHTLEDRIDWVYSVAWSPDGTHLATGGNDGTVRIWAPSAGSFVCTLLPLPGGSAAFGPDGLTYKFEGSPAGRFWWTIGLCTFAPGELDPYIPEIRRIPYDSPLSALAPSLTGQVET
ncbi:hypothetical protein AB0395_05415, partial [Streptosporangium sp. NPDC051023]